MGVVISKCFVGESWQYTSEFIDPNSIPIAGAVPNAILCPDSGKASFNLVKEKEGETQEQVRSFKTCYSAFENFGTALKFGHF